MDFYQPSMKTAPQALCEWMNQPPRPVSHAGGFCVATNLKQDIFLAISEESQHFSISPHQSKVDFLKFTTAKTE